jgi:hypothetical protein
MRDEGGPVISTYGLLLLCTYAYRATGTMLLCGGVDVWLRQLPAAGWIGCRASLYAVMFLVSSYCLAVEPMYCTQHQNVSQNAMHCAHACAERTQCPRLAHTILLKASGATSY